MKTISKKIILAFTFLLICTNANSQGIRIDGICYSGINGDYLSPAYWGISYDHNVGDKISLSFGYRTPFASTDLYSNPVDYAFPSTSGDVRFTVYHSNKWKEFAFTSKYFFSDNSDGSYFASSAISLMLATNTYRVGNISAGGNQQPSAEGIQQGDYEQSITLIPLAFDIGHRSEFDGFYLEYYVGMQFTPFGTNPEVEPVVLANHGVEMRYSSFAIQAGLCLGFSWVK